MGSIIADADVLGLTELLGGQNKLIELCSEPVSVEEDEALAEIYRDIRMLVAQSVQFPYTLARPDSQAWRQDMLYDTDTIFHAVRLE